MKRILICSAIQAIALLSFAQEKIDITDVTLDLAEDTAKVTTIADIIDVQEMVTTRNSSLAHYDKVWSYTSYFNIAYTSSTLKPKDNIKLGYDNYNGDRVPEFKSDWGLSLQLGHNYSLLKKAVANMVQFNIDFTYIDLNVNHYKANDGKTYDSANMGNDGHKYVPWCMEKYEINYGMALGPSVTVAPFTTLDIPQLHFLKLNLYYHIGYHVSALVMPYNKTHDAGYDEDAYRYSSPSPALNWGHGLMNSFGLNLSWKSIGLGYEMRSGSLQYRPFDKNEYGKGKYKFKDHNNRIYLEIRY